MMNFFLMLIEESFVIEIRELQQYLEKKLMGLKTKTQDVLDTDDDNKEKWHKLNIRTRRALNSYFIVLFDELKNDKDSFQRELFNLAFDEKALSDFQEKFNLYFDNMGLPFYDLAISVYKKMVDASEIKTHKPVKITDITAKSIHWEENDKTVQKYFPLIVIAEGAGREVLNLAKQHYNGELEEVELPKHRHKTHGAVICNVDIAKYKIPKERHLITSFLPNSSHVKKSDLPRFKKNGWQKDFCPLTYIQVAEKKNIIYVTGEVPDIIKKKPKEVQSKLLLDWAKKILKIEYNLPSDAVTDCKSSYLFTLGRKALKDNAFFLEVEEGNFTNFYMVGDCTLPANYLYGHGVGYAFLDANDVAFDRFVLGQGHHRLKQHKKIERYSELSSAFNTQVSLSENYPLLAKLFLKGLIYKNDVVWYLKLAGALGICGAIIQTVLNKESLADTQSVAWQFFKGFVSSGFTAGIGCVSHFLYKDHKEKKSLEEEGTVIVFNH